MLFIRYTPKTWSLEEVSARISSVDAHVMRGLNLLLIRARPSASGIDRGCSRIRYFILRGTLSVPVYLNKLAFAQKHRGMKRNFSDAIQIIESKHLSPICGDGNFLIDILHEKMSVLHSLYARSQTDYELNTLVAIFSIYGIDPINHNITICRDRLYNIISLEYISIFQNSFIEDFLLTIRHIIERNIIWGDALTLRTPDGEDDLIFTEWSIEGEMVGRMDLYYRDMLGSYKMSEYNLFFNRDCRVFKPQPIRVFSPVNYLDI